MPFRPSTIAIAFLAFASASTLSSAEERRSPTQAEDDHVRDLVKAYIEAHPDVVFNAVNGYVASVRANKETVRDKAILQSRTELTQVAGLPSVGNPDGKVVMVYFLDGACGYCRRSVGTLDELTRKNPDLKIVHRWIPLLSPASEYAARVATVVGRRYASNYPAFYHVLMTQNGALTNDVVDKVVGQTVGQDALGPVKQEAMDQSDGNAYARSVASDNALAHRLKIDGTPFFYVDGAGTDGIVFGALGYDRLASAVGKARRASEGH